MLELDEMLDSHKALKDIQSVADTDSRLSLSVQQLMSVQSSTCDAFQDYASRASGSSSWYEHTWVARCSYWLLIKLTLKGVVISFLLLFFF